MQTYDLFHQYEDVPIQTEHSQKVARTLLNHLGFETYSDICQAINAHETTREQQKNINKAEALYKTVVLALAMKEGFLCGGALTEQLCRTCGYAARFDK